MVHVRSLAQLLTGEETLLLALLARLGLALPARLCALRLPLDEHLESDGGAGSFRLELLELLAKFVLIRLFVHRRRAHHGDDVGLELIPLGQLVLVLARRAAGAVPEPTVLARLHRLQEVLAYDGGGIGAGRLGAVLLGDDALKFCLIPKLHGVSLVRLVVFVDVALNVGAAALEPRHDVHLVAELALLRRLGAASVPEVLAEDRLGIHTRGHLLLLDGDTLGAEEELLSLLRRLAGGAGGGLAELGGGIVHVLEALGHDLVLRDQALLLAEGQVLVRELLLLANVLGLFLLDLIVGHARLLGPEAVLLRGRLSHLGVRACASASAGVERTSERAFLLRSGGRSRSPRPSRGRERSRPRECLASWRKRRKEDAFASSVDGSRP